MLLNELATSSDTKIKKINRVLKETFGFTLVSEVATGKLNTLYTKIADDLYDLKLDLSNCKSPDYMQKVLVLEGLKLLIEKNTLSEGLRSGPGSNAYERVNKWLSQFVQNACEVGDEYEEAIRDAMKQYRSSKYRFEDFEVEHDLRKVTAECADQLELGMVEGKLPDALKQHQFGKKDDDKEADDNEADDKEADDKEADDKEEVNETLENIKPQNIWWENDPEELMTFIYWKRDQIPPANKVEAWDSIVQALSKRNPPPADWVNPMAVEEGGDRHAEHDWVQGMKKDAGIGPGYEDDTSGLSILDPEDDTQPEADDFFSYRSKQKRTEMKEGYIKNLRRLLEAETDQAESLIAAKSFSQELQDMVEKLGRLVNENLPAVSEQMRDAYGSDVATGFEDQVSGTLNTVMDSLRNSKQEIDNSVSTIADGGAPVAGNDMEDFSDEELGGEFGDDELDLDGDVELELGDDELGLGDEFGGDDAMAGLEDEPLGRAKKESLKIIGKKIVEAQAKLQRIKARS